MSGGDAQESVNTPEPSKLVGTEHAQAHRAKIDLKQQNWSTDHIEYNLDVKTLRLPCLHLIRA